MKAASIGGDALALILGIAAWFSVHIVGDLYISEIILLPLLPILILVHPRRIFRPGLRVVLALAGIWFFGQWMTDLYRSTEIIDSLRTYANIGFFVIDLVGLAVLLGENTRRQAVFISGFAFGALLAVRYQPSIWIDSDPWKFGYAFGVNLTAILVICYFYSRRLYAIVGLLLAGMMAVNLFMNYRSPVLIFMVTTVLILPVIPEQVGRLRLLPHARSSMRIVVLAAIALSAGFAASGLVHYATSAGLINSEAQAKNESQSETGVGMLIGGRPEILVSARAVWDSPILGHGAGAKDYKYIEMLNDLEAQFGTPLDLQDIEEEKQGLIPTHSHLMDAWVKAGILGGIFWAYVWWMALKAVFRVGIQRHALVPVYTFMLVELLWDILFSPFGGARRTTDALAIVIILSLVESTTIGLERMKRQRRVEWRRGPHRGGFAPSSPNACSVISNILTDSITD